MKKLKLTPTVARRMLQIQCDRLKDTPLVDDGLVALKIGDAGLMWRMARLMKGFELEPKPAMSERMEVLK